MFIHFNLAMERVNTAVLDEALVCTILVTSAVILHDEASKKRKKDQNLLEISFSKEICMELILLRQMFFEKKKPIFISTISSNEQRCL